MGDHVGSDAMTSVTITKFVTHFLEIVANVWMDFRKPNVMNVSSFSILIAFCIFVRDMIGKKINITSYV